MNGFTTSIALTRLVAVLMALGGTLGALATAQAAPGDGLRAGNLRLSPGLRLGTAFDSNVYYLANDESARQPGAPTALIEPRLQLSTIDPVDVQWSFDGAVGWTHYLSDDRNLVGQSGLATNLAGAVVINPEGLVSLRIGESFVRTNETPDDVSDVALNRIVNRAGLRLGLHPTGRVLESYLSYDFMLMRHNIFPDVDRNGHELLWRASWKFLPRTALLAQADWRMIGYNEALRRPSRGTATEQNVFPNVDSAPLRLYGGLSGLITNRLGLRLLGGYGIGFYDDGEDFSGLVTQLEGSYAFGPSGRDQKLRLGYERNFQDSIISNFSAFHRFSGGYEHKLSQGRVRLGLASNLTLRDYSELPVTQVTLDDSVVNLPENVSDLLLGINANLGLDLAPWWKADLGYSYSSNFTEDRIDISGPFEDVLRAFSRHHLNLTTTFAY